MGTGLHDDARHAHASEVHGSWAGESGGSPAFAIAGLAFYFDARAGVTANAGTLSQWQDQAHGFVLNAKGAAASFPTFSASGGPNGLPSVNFSGSQAILNAAAVPWSTATGTIFMVHKINATGTGFLSMIGAAASSFCYAILGGTRDFRNGADLDDGAAQFSTYEAWTATSDGTNRVLRVNGSQVGADAAGVGTAAAAGISIGANVAGANPVNCNVCLFFGYSRVLSPAEISQVEGWIRSLSGLW